MVDYARQTVDCPNSVARFAHRRRIAHALRTVAEMTPCGGTVVDFGCGPGTFLHELGAQRTDLSLIGYDPFAQQMFSEVRVVAEMATIPTASVNVLTALETCEHLEEDELCFLIDETRRLLATDGCLLVSVPIIGGPGLLAKEANRMLLHRRWTDYTVPELAKAVFLGTPARCTPNINTSHKGFDFRELERRLARDLRRVRAWFCPFSALPWYLNSQAFSVWRV